MSEKNELTIVRTFDAPRELVWKAWTEPEHCKQWWGPKEYTSPDCSIDFHVGGKYLNSMMDDKGNKIWSTGEYLEIIPMEKIVATDSFADEKGNVVSSEHYGMKGMPIVMKITVMFEDEGGKTKMTLIHEGLPAGEHQSSANQGWNSMFDKLDEFLKTLKK